MDPTKSRIKIENFIDLISLGTVESPEKYINVDEIEPGLASFRINIETGINSKRGTPTCMSNLQISPIIAIVQPNRNFSTESQAFLNATDKKPEKLLILPEDQTEEDEEKSISLLTPNLKKMKFNQFTPTFPLKPDENISWSDISYPKLGEHDGKAPFVNENEGFAGFEDISNIEKESHSGGIGTYIELPSILECGTEKIREEEKVVEVRVDPIVNDLGNKPQVESSLLSMQLSESGCNQSYAKFDETIVFSDSLCKDSMQRPSPMPKEQNPRRPLFKTNSNPSIRPIKRLSLISKIAKTETSATPISHSKGVKKDKRMIFRPDSICNSRGLSQYLTSPEMKAKEKSFNSKLPKLRDPLGKAKSKTIGNPYLPYWSKSTLKTHFNLDMKIQKDTAGVKALVTKCVKKRVKIIK